MSTPAVRTKEKLESLGWYVWKTEVWHHFAKRRIDLFNLFDHLAIPPLDSGLRCVMGVQTTTGANLSAHRYKADSIKYLRPWLNTGNQFEIWSWQKEGKRGERKLWTLTREVAILSPEGQVSFEEIATKKENP